MKSQRDFIEIYEISEAGARGEGTMGTFVHREGENVRALRIEIEHRDFIIIHEISGTGGHSREQKRTKRRPSQTGRTSRLGATYRRNPAGRGGDFIYKEQYGGGGGQTDQSQPTYHQGNRRRPTPTSFDHL